MAKLPPEEDPKKLLKRIRELEVIIDTQQMVIEVLRSMPGAGKEGHAEIKATKRYVKSKRFTADGETSDSTTGKNSKRGRKKSAAVPSGDGGDPS